MRIGADVGLADVIAPDDDDVRLLLRMRGSRYETRNRERNRENCVLLPSHVLRYLPLTKSICIAASKSGRSSSLWRMSMTRPTGRDGASGSQCNDCLLTTTPAVDLHTSARGSSFRF